MKTRFLALVLLFTGMITGAAFGENTYPIDTKLESCLEKNPSTQGMVECIETAAKEWDAELNKYYKLLQNNLDKNGKDALKKSQLEWIKFRDAEYEMLDNMLVIMQGTMYQPVVASMKMKIVKERALKLKDYYETFFLGGE